MQETFLKEFDYWGVNTSSVDLMGDAAVVKTAAASPDDDLEPVELDFEYDGSGALSPTRQPLNSGGVHNNNNTTCTAAAVPDEDDDVEFGGDAQRLRDLARHSEGLGEHRDPDCMLDAAT